jgi:hypothetical protein
MDQHATQIDVATLADVIVRQSHTEEIREAAAQLANAQVAIYPVDVRGLVSGMEASINDLPSRQPVSLTDNADVHVSVVTDTQETMREVALETGGRAFVNQNEIKNSVALSPTGGRPFSPFG